MPPLPARAAAVRGDNFQYLVGFVAALDALLDDDVVSVSVEDAAGGSFDDVVTRRRTTFDTYVQVKSSNYGNVVVDEAWLTTAVTANGKSPLQHFYGTWEALSSTGRPFELSLVTVRAFDAADPILGSIRDLTSDHVDVAALRAAGTRTNLGKARRRWSTHLGCTDDQIAEFLAAVRWRHTGGEREWFESARVRMHAAGLRSDDEAITVGVDMVRSWVTTGAGPQTTADIRRQVAERDLLARTGVLTLAVHGIDRFDTTVTRPNVTVDVVDCYAADDASDRYKLRDPDGWQATVLPAIRDAARTLEGFATRTVHVTGAMRLPMHFAVGRVLPEVRGWTLSADQQGSVCSTTAHPQSGVTAVVSHEEHIGNGGDLIVAVALTRDLTSAVQSYVESASLQAAELVVLGAEGGPSNRSVPTEEWLTAWVQSARNEVAARTQRLRAQRIHLFMSAPAVAAMMLGHQWNALPVTTLYEFDRYDYFPTFDIR